MYDRHHLTPGHYAWWRMFLQGRTIFSYAIANRRKHPSHIHVKITWVSIIPMKGITIRTRDPPYMTPYLKHMLRFLESLSGQLASMHIRDNDYNWVLALLINRACRTKLFRIIFSSKHINASIKQRFALWVINFFTILSWLNPSM